MGALYLARDPHLDRLVAIKLLKEELQDDTALRERFLREARSVARLRHSNIVIVFDVGEDAGRPFMAMEYIAGETLAQVLRQRPSLAVTRRLQLVEDLCAGLAHAHGAGIIHRDIKPANMMLDGDGVLKILDFGIARLGNSGMTQEGMMMGTVNYMSPEQVTGRGVDHRTDIFAAGAVLYEAISLAQAFPGGIDTGVLHRILNEGPVPLNQLVPGIDRELLGIVQRALDRDPAQRYQDANVMRREILQVRRRLMDEGAAGTLDSRATTAISEVKPAPSGTGRRPDSDRPRRLNPERFAELQRQQVSEHLTFAEEAFARGDHDAALQHAERAATVDPDSRAAFDLIDRARFAIESKAIRQLLTQAQRLLVDGHLDDAAALADEASVTFPDVHGAAELRDEVRQIADRIAAAREREQRIVTSLERARSSLDRGGFETALRAVYEVLSIDPDRAEARALEQEAQTRLLAQREHERARRAAYDHITRARTLADEGKYEEAAAAIATVTPPSDTVRVAAADALNVVRAAQRQAALAAILTRAREAVDRGLFADAVAAIDSIPTNEQTREAKALRDTADRALREQRDLARKRAALDSAVTAVEALIERGELVPAQERLAAAWTIGLADERLPALGTRLKRLVAEAEARRQQQNRDRLAAQRVAAARQLLANGDGYAAVNLLERDAGHPLVEEALKEIRAAIAEQEDRVRQEAERRRQEDEAKRRAEAEAARKLEEARKAEERRQLDEERRRRDAERQRHRQEVATLLVDAERAIAADQPHEATVLLKRADERVESVEDTELRRRVAEMKANAERQARERLEEVRKRDEETRKRNEEIRRREEEARRREQALADLLEKAHTTPAHDDALTILNEALTLAPTDTRVQQRLQERRAAVEQQRIDEERAREDARRQAEVEAARRLEEQRRAAEAERLAKEEETRRQEARRREEEARLREQEARRVEEERRQRDEAARLERERLEQQQRDAQAAALVQEAQTLFSAGQQEEAFTVLRGSPVHALTQAAVHELEARRSDIERQRRRLEQQRLGQERRAARLAAVTSAVRDRRVQLAGAVVIGVILVWAVWQNLPPSAPEVAINKPPAAPAPTLLPSAPPPTTAPPPVTPPTTGTTASPPTTGRGAGASGVTQPATSGGRAATRGNQPVTTTTTPPVVTTPPTGGDNAQPVQTPTPALVEQPVPVPQPQPPQPIPAPQVNPALPSPTEPRVDLAAERAAIQQIIGRYAAAYSRLDENELRRIDPGFTSIPSRVLLKSVELTPSGIAIDVDPTGQTATARFTQNFRYEWNRARIAPTRTGNLVWELRKVGGEWRVVKSAGAR